jgi:hypothetical protein
VPASILVAEHGGRNRGPEVRGIACRTGDEGAVVTRRITLRYLGPERTRRDMQELEGIELVHVRLESGELRAWDFADECWSYPEKAG